MPGKLKSHMTAVKWRFGDSANVDPACAIFMFERVVKPFADISLAGTLVLAEQAKMPIEPYRAIKRSRA